MRKQLRGQIPLTTVSVIGYLLVPAFFAVVIYCAAYHHNDAHGPECLLAVAAIFGYWFWADRWTRRRYGVEMRRR